MLYSDFVQVAVRAAVRAVTITVQQAQETRTLQPQNTMSYSTHLFNMYMYSYMYTRGMYRHLCTMLQYMYLLGFLLSNLTVL